VQTRLLLVLPGLTRRGLSTTPLRLWRVQGSARTHESLCALAPRSSHRDICRVRDRARPGLSTPSVSRPMYFLLWLQTLAPGQNKVHRKGWIEQRCGPARQRVRKTWPVFVTISDQHHQELEYQDMVMNNIQQAPTKSKLLERTWKQVGYELGFRVSKLPYPMLQFFPQLPSSLVDKRMKICRLLMERAGH